MQYAHILLNSTDVDSSLAFGAELGYKMIQKFVPLFLHVRHVSAQAFLYQSVVSLVNSHHQLGQELVQFLKLPYTECVLLQILCRSYQLTFELESFALFVKRVEASP